MENLKPEPCPCCGAEMETFVHPKGWRILRPRTRGCSICRYLAEGSFDVSLRLVEDWNLRAGPGDLYDALKVTLAALERDDWEADQPAIKMARAALAQAASYRDDLLEACKKAIEVTGGSKYWNGGTNEFLEMMELAIAKAEGKEVTNLKRPPIPADVAAQIDHDEEIYGNAFVTLSGGNWKRLDPTKVAIKTEEGKPAPELSEAPKITYKAMEEGLKTILSHAGSAIECADEPGKTYLREICEIVDHIHGEDTSEEEEEKPAPVPHHQFTPTKIDGESCEECGLPRTDNVHNND